MTVSFWGQTRFASKKVVSQSGNSFGFSFPLRVIIFLLCGLFTSPNIFMFTCINSFTVKKLCLPILS